MARALGSASSVRPTKPVKSREEDAGKSHEGGQFKGLWEGGERGKERGSVRIPLCQCLGRN